MKSENESGKRQHDIGKFRPLYLLCTGHDNVLISVTHGRCTHFTECHLSVVLWYMLVLRAWLLLQAYIVFSWLACCFILDCMLTPNWWRCLHDDRWRQMIPAAAAAAAILQWNWWCLMQSTRAPFCTAVWVAATSSEPLRRFKWCWDSCGATDVCAQTFHRR